jgi:hypothetical protein
MVVLRVREMVAAADAVFAVVGFGRVGVEVNFSEESGIR